MKFIASMILCFGFVSREMVEEFFYEKIDAPLDNVLRIDIL